MNIVFYLSPLLPLRSLQKLWQFGPIVQHLKLARLRLYGLFSFGLLFLAAIFLILALPFRFSTRVVGFLSNQVRPFVVRPLVELSTTNRKSITTSPPAMNTAIFQKPSQAPPVFVATADSILKDTKDLTASSKALEDKLAAGVKPEDAAFENVINSLAQDENRLSLSAHILVFYQAVSSQKELRDASTKADEILNEYGIESSMREDIYRLVESAYQRKEELDAESHRLVQKIRKQYIKNGLNIEAGPKRDRFKEIKLRLSQLSISFQKTLNEEDGGIWFTREELDGTPEDVIGDLAKGTGDNEGKLRLTFKYPHLFPVMKYAKNSATRKKLYMENENKANSNVALFKETVVLRDEAARLLGYGNHAAFRIEDKMAKTPKHVEEFLNDLKTRLKPQSLKELEVLKEWKKQDLSSRGEKDDGHYFAWDHRYYSTIQLEKDYQVDQEKLAEYFPMQTTLRKMLQIFEKLLGLKFVEVKGADRDAISPTTKGEDIVWHEDVQLFTVWNDEQGGGDFVGYLYTDMHPRLGKYGHAANFNIQPGWRMENGTIRRPATALVCNFSKPTPKKPSLLKHDEVVTLFHELGHGIHDLVSKTKYSRFHGTSVVQDFVEAPSQMLENWVWTPSQLRFLSQHYSYISDSYLNAWKETAGPNSDHQPPETLPDDLIQSLIKTRHVNEALSTLRQLHFGLYDMKVHTPSSHQEIEDLKPSLLWGQFRHDLIPIDGPEVSDGAPVDWGNGEATFGHLMGGYDAG